MIEIVCATGGTCGDIITAIIDSKNVEFNNFAVRLPPERCLLKKPHSFTNDLDKNNYIESMSLLYNSIPSHQVDFHVRNQHSFIAITVDNFDIALWAATRFKKIHKPHVWEEMQTACGANTIEEYAQIIIDYSKMVREHTTKLLSLERIRDGYAVEDLKQITTVELNNEFYQQWLKLQQDAC